MQSLFVLAQEFTIQWDAHAQPKGRKSRRKAGRKSTKSPPTSAAATATSKVNLAPDRAYWIKHQCDALPLALAVVFYDCAVYLGCEFSVSTIQNAANIVGGAYLDVFEPVAMDGRWDKRTISLCRALQEYHLDFYTARMAVRNRMSHHTKMSKNAENPSHEKEKWQARYQGILEHLAMLERGGL